MSFFDILFPKRCVGCGKTGTYFCVNCIKLAKRPIQQICPACKKPSMDGVIHARCKRGYLPDGLFIVWEYTGAPRTLVTKLKYKFVYELALTIASSAYGALRSYKRSVPQAINWESEDIVLVPIPLSVKRSNWRGFNQSEEITKLVGKFSGWKVETLLKRVKNTHPQVGLSREQRQRNIASAFELNSVKEDLKNMQIVLFDDVWTTGSTMLEAARVLKNNGFKKVWCLTLAR